MDIIVLALWIGVYIGQIILVIIELDENNYSRKLNVIIDLIPFSWILTGSFNIIIGLYDLITKSKMAENFKKLKW